MKELERAFGKAFKKLREEKGLSQMDIVKRCGIERTVFQRYDAGRRVPVVKNIILIAEALEVSPGTILDLAYRYFKEGK